MASNEHYALQASAVALYNQSVDDGVFQDETRKLFEFLITGRWGDGEKVAGDFHLSCELDRDAPRTIKFMDAKSDGGKPRVLKPSKWLQYINRQFEFGLDPKAIEYMATSLGEILPAKWGFDFELIRGEPIIEAYQSITHSCMTKALTLNFYVDNPETVGLLKIMKDGAAVGRALLWTLEDGSKFLDRIYPNSGAHVEETLKYAVRQGWVTRSDQRAPRDLSSRQKIPTTALLNNVRSESQTAANSMGPFPFLDTFNYMCHSRDRKHVRLSNRPRDGFVPVQDPRKAYRGQFYCELSDGWFDEGLKYEGFVHQADGTSRKVQARMDKIKSGGKRFVSVNDELYEMGHPELATYKGRHVLRSELVVPAGFPDGQVRHVGECMRLADGNYICTEDVSKLSYVPNGNADGNATFVFVRQGE